MNSAKTVGQNVGAQGLASPVVQPLSQTANHNADNNVITMPTEQRTLTTTTVRARTSTYEFCARILRKELTQNRRQHSAHVRALKIFSICTTVSSNSLEITDEYVIKTSASARHISTNAGLQLGQYATASRALFPSLIVCLSLAYCKLLQELGYREQIARQLRTWHQQ